MLRFLFLLFLKLKSSKKKLICESAECPSGIPEGAFESFSEGTRLERKQSSYNGMFYISQTLHYLVSLSVCLGFSVSVYVIHFQLVECLRWRVNNEIDSILSVSHSSPYPCFVLCGIRSCFFGFRRNPLCLVSCIVAYGTLSS